MTYNGKDSEKEHIYYIFVKWNNLAIHQKLTQHFKSTILQLKTEKKVEEVRTMAPAAVLTLERTSG